MSIGRAGKKLTRSQREHVQALGMSATDWLICKCQLETWTLVHRFTGQQKEIRSPEWM